ncbi:phage tail protein [Clostridium paraputrificum]|jgi:hypothetical protein|uniref:phage tail protein n=1 Tax=Clostridium paraputrificum TaxID=29363 RepID=UPI00374E2544
MALEVFKLFGSIMVNNEEANKNISKTEEKAVGLGEKFVKGIGTVGKWGAAVGAAAAAGGAALFGMANKAAGTTDRIDKLSQKIGMSRETFQEFDFICSQSGMSVENLQGGFKTLTKQMDSAMQGGKDATKAFNDLGLSTKDLANMSREDIFKKSITALQSMENETQKAAIANKIFGRSGSEMMPLLNGAAGSVDEMAKKAHELGLVLNDEAIDSGVVFTDTIDQLKRSFSSIVTKVGVNVMPLIQKFCDLILDNMPIIQSVVGTTFKFIEKFVKVIVNSLSKVVGKVSNLVKPIIDKFNEMGNTFKTSMEEFDDYGVAFKEMLEVLFGPIGDLPIFEEIGKVFSAIQEVIYRISEGEGISEALRNAFEWRDSEVGNMLLELMDFVSNIFTNIQDIIRVVIENINPIISGLADVFSIVMSVIGTVWESIGKPLWRTFEEYVKKVKEVFEVVFPIVASIFQDACAILKRLWEEILKPVFEAISGLISNYLLPTFTKVFSGVSSVVKSAFGFIKELWDNSLKPILNGIISFLSGVFTGNWKKVFNGLGDIVKGVFNGLVTIVKAPLNGIIKLINKVIDGFNSIKAPDWIPLIGGKGVNIPKIPMLYKGTDYFQGGKALVGEQGPELIEMPRGTKVNTAEETQNILNGGAQNVFILKIDSHEFITAVGPEMSNYLAYSGIGGR